MPIITLDECAIDLTTRMKKVWALRGSKPIGLIKNSIKRTHIIGALTGNKVIIEYAERVDSEKIIEFLDGLKSHYNKFVVVMDNAGWHRSWKIKDYIKANKNAVIIEYLPPYSPELNPTETCWKTIRKEVIDNNLFDDLLELKCGIREFVYGYDWNINLFNYLCP